MSFFDLKQLEYLKYIKSVQGVFIIILILLVTYLIVNKPTYKSETQIQFDKIQVDSLNRDTL